MATDKNRIEIISWRELFDDEDSLRIEVFAGEDATTTQDIIIRDVETDDEEPYTFDYDSPESVTHPCTTTNDHALIDGQVLTSHDGRFFRITITEIASGPCVNCQTQCDDDGICPKCKEHEENGVEVTA